MRTFTGALVGSLALSLVACGSGTQEPTGPASTTPGDTTPSTNTNNVPNTGETCANGAQQCSGMNLMVCQNSAWSTSTCDHLCQQAGLGAATGCMFDSNKGYETCFCGSTGGTCQDGEQQCSGMNLNICSGGSWSTAGCDFVCQQAGLGPAQSCGFDPSKGKDVCICGEAPTCQNGAQQCQGDSLATCTNSTWQVDSCHDLCELGGYGKAQGCGFDPSKGVDTCFCFNGNIGDPCDTDTDCMGTVCNVAGWCTDVCTHDYECGTNTLGEPNFCMETQGGSGACFPSCSSNTSCAAFPGTQCFSNVPSVDGTSASVCSTN